MSAGEAMQYWVAECQYPGRRSFWVGAFPVPKRASIETAQRKAQEAAVEFMRNIMPVTLVAPKVLQLKPGAMLLIFEEDDDG